MGKTYKSKKHRRESDQRRLKVYKREDQRAQNQKLKVFLHKEKKEAQ